VHCGLLPFCTQGRHSKPPAPGKSQLGQTLNICCFLMHAACRPWGKTTAGQAAAGSAAARRQLLQQNSCGEPLQTVTSCCASTHHPRGSPTPAAATQHRQRLPAHDLACCGTATKLKLANIHQQLAAAAAVGGQLSRPVRVGGLRSRMYMGGHCRAAAMGAPSLLSLERLCSKTTPTKWLHP
jgi:hypothetical protein